MTALPNPRCERKFIAVGFAVPEVVALVRRHPAGFRQTFPERSVNNIYLDSPDLADFHSHVNGTANRSKTRVRWYGDPVGPVTNPALERKLKRGSVSGKAVHPLPALALNGRALQAPLEAAFDRARLPESLRLGLRQLEPSLLNRYRRCYYVSADGLIRLTIDSDLQFARLSRTSSSPGSLPGCRRMVIVEFKFDPKDTDRAAAVTNAFPFRLARCSKYVLGLERSAPL